MLNKLPILIFFYISTLFAYPTHWWGPTQSDRPIPEWEILPEEGTFGESVVLSKRNELGILSNFAATSFSLDGKRYASLEGFWQSLKYPEDKMDNRYGMDKLPHSRRDVEQMTGFEAKTAGSHASKLMRKHQVDWVSYQGKKMIYRDPVKGQHYKLIVRAMIRKLQENKEVENILKQTNKLKLLPDHKTSPSDPPAWKYYKIWTEQRDRMLNKI